jgi:hypothetical protein
VWIQHELDVAALNAQKNRLIQDNGPTNPHSVTKKSMSKSAVDLHRADLQNSSGANSVTDCQTTSTKLQASSINNQVYPQSIEQGVEGHSTGISSLQTRFQTMIDEWSCVIKQAIFHEEMGLNEDRRHTPQLLVLL